MSTSAISPVSPGATLDQADFLKLLVTQMTSQDPLNPQSDTAFAAQLAQFSALQQSQTMSSNMQSLQANALIGRTVSVTSPDDTTQQISGVVSGVAINSGVPQVLLNNQLYDLSSVVSIAPTPVTTTP